MSEVSSASVFVTSLTAFSTISAALKLGSVKTTTIATPITMRAMKKANGKM
ncbi:MAG: hypothetical protein LKE92_05645 [Atopobiaceae bacterium]|nr:hypothetical protein [Atopobiaceae bacterium]